MFDLEVEQVVLQRLQLQVDLFAEDLASNSRAGQVGPGSAVVAGDHAVHLIVGDPGGVFDGVEDVAVSEAGGAVGDLVLAVWELLDDSVRNWVGSQFGRLFSPVFGSMLFSWA